MGRRLQGRDLSISFGGHQIDMMVIDELREPSVPLDPGAYDVIIVGCGHLVEVGAPKAIAFKEPRISKPACPHWHRKTFGRWA